MIVAWLQAQAWKIGTAAAVALVLLLGVKLIAAHVHEGALNREITALHKRIDDPLTGYVAKLAQCETNTSTLQTELDNQSRRVAELSAEGKVALAASEAALAATKGENARLDRRANEILTYAAKGGSVCERQQDQINHYLEGLK